VGRLTTRSANFTGVELQRSGHLNEAAQLFDLALKLDPSNFAAQANQQVNAALAASRPVPDSAMKLTEEYKEDAVLTVYGAVDEPFFLERWGQSCRQSGDDLLRQAITAFLRAHELAPNNAKIASLLAEAWLGAD